jgi:hypothetical protein
MQRTENLVELARKVKALPPEEHQKRIQALVKAFAKRRKASPVRSPAGN